MNEIKFKVDVFFGSVEIKETMRLEGNDLILGGMGITRDEAGKVIKVEQSDNCVLRFE